MKRQEDMTLKDELPKAASAHMLLEKGGEITPERMKRWNQSEKKHPIVDVTGDLSKVQCYKEQYCIGTCNVRSVNQGTLEVVKRRWQE